MKRLLLFLMAALLACLALSPCANAATDGDEAVNDVSLQGEWRIAVPGHSTVCVGRDQMPWEFSFYDPSTGAVLGSFLMANAFPLSGEEAACFEDDWLGTAQTLQRCAYDYFGGLIDRISFARYSPEPGVDVYVVFLVLQNEDRRMEVTACYRFPQSYYAAYLGVNTGDLPDLFYRTRRAAALFEDYTAAPLTAQPEFYAGRAIAPDRHEWTLPVYNLYGVLWDYSRWEFAGHSGG